MDFVSSAPTVEVEISMGSDAAQVEMVVTLTKSERIPKNRIGPVPRGHGAPEGDSVQRLRGRSVGARLNGNSRQSMVSIRHQTPLMDPGMHDRAASGRCAGGEVRAMTMRGSALLPRWTDRRVDENDVPISRNNGRVDATVVRLAAHDDRSGSRGA